MEALAVWKSKRANPVCNAKRNDPEGACSALYKIIGNFVRNSA